MIVKVDNTKYVKDETTNTIINTDIDGYKQYKVMRDINKQISLLNAKVNALEARVAQLTEKLG